MTKGCARILLHGKQEFLVKSLKEFRTLYEITVALEVEGVKISTSSLYRYLVSDLNEVYLEYLRYTGRGLIGTRQNKGVNGAAQNNNPNLSLARKSEAITNAGDVSKFLKDKTKRFL